MKKKEEKTGAAKTMPEKKPKPKPKKKGKTNNPNGRPRGVPNKITRDVKESAKELVDFLFSKIKANELSNAEVIEITKILMPFVCTKEEKMIVDNNISAIDTLKNQLFGKS